MIATDFSYVLQLEAAGGEEAVIPAFRCFQLAVGDVYPYGQRDWVVTEIQEYETDTTSFELWAKPVEPPGEPSEPPLQPPIEPPTEPPSEPEPEPWPVPPPEPPWPQPPTEPPLEPPAH